MKVVFNGGGMKKIKVWFYIFVAVLAIIGLNTVANKVQSIFSKPKVVKVEEPKIDYQKQQELIDIFIYSQKVSALSFKSADIFNFIGEEATKMGKGEISFEEFEKAVNRFNKDILYQISEVRNITPPPALMSIHTKVIEAYSNLSVVASLMDRFISTKNEQYITDATIKMNNFVALLGEVTREVDGKTNQIIQEYNLQQ